MRTLLTRARLNDQIKRYQSPVIGTNQTNLIFNSYELKLNQLLGYLMMFSDSFLFKQIFKTVLCTNTVLKTNGF